MEIEVVPAAKAERDEPRGRARRTAIAASAALAVAGAVAYVTAGQVGPVRRTDGVPPSRPPAAPAASVATEEPQTDPSDPATTQPAGSDWERPDLRLSAFPLTPTWLPPRSGKPTVSQVGPDLRLEFQGGRLSVSVGALPPDWDFENTARSVSVRGRPATLRTTLPGKNARVIEWRLPDGRWVGVYSDGGLSERGLRRFAAALIARPIAPGRAPFSFATAPRGFRLQSWNEEGMCLAPASLLRQRNVGLGICVALSDTTTGEGDPAAVAGRAAMVVTEWNGAHLEVVLGPRRILMVDTYGPEARLTRAEIIRFAEGITVHAA